MNPLKSVQNTKRAYFPLKMMIKKENKSTRIGVVGGHEPAEERAEHQEGVRPLKRQIERPQ
jgi:hypothetical protein